MSPNVGEPWQHRANRGLKIRITNVYPLINEIWFQYCEGWHERMQVPGTLGVLTLRQLLFYYEKDSHVS